MAVTERDVRHVAQLARLGVKDAELPSLMRHFDGILAHFHRLNELDLSEIDPFDAAAWELTPWRADEAVDAGIRDEALREAPERKGDFFRVPRILEED